MMSPARILLVDDDPIMLELASTRLREAGYDVNACADGVRALVALERDGADLVISDIDMPILNGFELTKIIRAHPRLSEKPVIVITSSDGGEAVDEAFAAGATSFLSKPINWSLFNHSVRFVLRASETQRALREARDRAEAGDRFKDNLMSVMSHELRTPLNAIIGFGQLVAAHFDKQDDTVNKEYTDYILESGKRLLNSVSDMLLASEARTGSIAISETSATVEEIVADALASLEKSIAISGAKISVKLQNPRQEVRCDQALLSRAIGKLVDNSIKFGRRGVRVLIASALTPAGDLALLVKDDGPGVPRDKVDEFKAMFAQSDMSISRSKEGLGLGIPLTQAIAQAHGAAFRLSSRGDGAAEDVGADGCEKARAQGGTECVVVLPAARLRPLAADMAAPGDGASSDDPGRAAPEAATPGPARRTA